MFGVCNITLSRDNVSHDGKVVKMGKSKPNSALNKCKYKGSSEQGVCSVAYPAYHAYITAGC